MNSNHTSWIDGCGPGWGCTADASQEVDFRTPTTLEPSSSPSPAMAPCSAVLGHVMLQENLLIFGICGQAMSQLTMMEPDDKMNHTGTLNDMLCPVASRIDLQDYMAEKLGFDKNFSLNLCILLYK